MVKLASSSRVNDRRFGGRAFTAVSGIVLPSSAKKEAVFTRSEIAEAEVLSFFLMQDLGSHSVD